MVPSLFYVLYFMLYKEKDGTTFREWTENYRLYSTPMFFDGTKGFRDACIFQEFKFTKRLRPLLKQKKN